MMLVVVMVRVNEEGGMSVCLSYMLLDMLEP